MNLQTLIEEDFGYEKGSGKWGRSAKHDSLVLNEESQFWFWNSRGIRGGLLEYLTLVRGMSKESAEKSIKHFSPIYGFSENGEVEASRPYDKLVDLLWASGKTIREYWYNRCLTDETIDKFRLGHFDGWFLIPMFEDGEFRNFQCRREVPDKRIKQWYKHTKPVLFNGDILPFLNRVFITEGTVDAILLTQLGFPAVSQCGTNIWRDDWFEKFLHIKDIIYVEDNDSAGRNASKLIANKLGYERVRILSYEGQEDKFDTVDFFRSGNSKEDFEEMVNSKTKHLYELENVNDKRRNRRS